MPGMEEPPHLPPSLFGEYYLASIPPEDPSLFKKAHTRALGSRSARRASGASGCFSRIEAGAGPKSPLRHIMDDFFVDNELPLPHDHPLQAFNVAMVKEGSYLEKALPIPIDTAMVQRVLEPPQTGLHHSPGLFDDRIWINSLNPTLPKLRHFPKYAAPLAPAPKKRAHKIPRSKLFLFTMVPTLSAENRLALLQSTLNSCPFELMFEEADIEKVKVCVDASFDELRELFFYYAPLGGSRAPNCMNLNQFIQLARLCKLTDKRLSTTTISMMFTQVNVEVAFDAEKKNKGERAIELVADDDNPDNELILDEFIEMLLRCCVLRYKKTDLALEEYWKEFMNKHIIHYAMGAVDKAKLTRILMLEPQMQGLLSQYDSDIKKTFNREAPKSGPKQWDQQTALAWLEKHKLLDRELTRREAAYAFAASQDPNTMAKGTFVMRYPETMEFMVRIGDLKYAVDDVYAMTGPQLGHHFGQLCLKLWGEKKRPPAT